VEETSQRPNVHALTAKGRGIPAGLVATNWRMVRRRTSSAG
jgi:hypothetical protein